MKSFPLIVLVVLSMKARGDSVTKCSMGDYDYKGKIHSDQYKMNSTRGESSCSERDRVDEKVLKESFDHNQNEIDKVIAEILNDPACKDSWDIVRTYQERIKKSQDLFSQYTQERIVLVKSLVKELDIQYGFAYLGAFSSTCAGGQNRKNTFIDLDLINKIPETPEESVRVTKNGEVLESCSDVLAYGSDDLKTFKVSTKNAQGSDFQVLFDPYGIPDQVLVKSASGQLLYDSGCKGNEGGQPDFKKIPLNQAGGMVTFDVVNNCADPNREKGVSHWVIKMQCASPPAVLCKEKKDKLVQLLKEQIELYKRLMDASSLQRECYFYLEKDVLLDLLHDQLIGLEDEPLRNGVCETGDEDCEVKNLEEKHSDKGKLPPLLPLRDPGSVEEEHRCSSKEANEGLFQKISRAYCQVGWKKLGLENEVKDLK